MDRCPHVNPPGILVVIASMRTYTGMGGGPNKHVDSFLPSPRPWIFTTFSLARFPERMKIIVNVTCQGPLSAFFVWRHNQFSHISRSFLEKNTGFLLFFPMQIIWEIAAELRYIPRLRLPFMCQSLWCCWINIWREFMTSCAFMRRKRECKKISSSKQLFKQTKLKWGEEDRRELYGRGEGMFGNRICATCVSANRNTHPTYALKRQ